MRRTAALLTSTALLMMCVAPATAASKPYIGGPCKLVHQIDWIKGVRAQCTRVPANSKKNGKLVWRALAPAKTTTTKAELSPATTPTTPAPAIPQTFDELATNVPGIAYGAWKRSAEVMATSQPRSISASLRIGPTTSVPRIETETAFSQLTRLFPKVPMPKHILLVVHNYADTAWASSAVSQELSDGYAALVQRNGGGEITAGDCESTGTCLGGKQLMDFNSRTSVLLFGDTGLSAGSSTDRLVALTHEATHSVQAAQTESVRYWGPIPRWVVEGGAEWTAILLASSSFEDYIKLRMPRIDGLVQNRSTYDAKWIETLLRTTNWDAPYEHWRWYDVGLLAVEVLTVLNGPDSWMQLFTEVSKGKDFPTAFEAIYGTSWDSTVPKIAAAIAAGL